MMSNRVGIALGSNLGSRLTHLREARDMLRKLVDPEALYLQAPVYQSEPVGCRESAPDFFNTIIEVGYKGEPYELLMKTQGIEFHLGRESVYEKNAPRVIDLDILYFGDVSMSDEILSIPHPGLLDRRFVLEPLNDIRPDLILPGDQVSISKHLRHLESDEPPLTLVQTNW